MSTTKPKVGKCGDEDNYSKIWDSMKHKNETVRTGAITGFGILGLFASILIGVFRDSWIAFGVTLCVNMYLIFFAILWEHAIWKLAFGKINSTDAQRRILAIASAGWAVITLGIFGLCQWLDRDNDPDTGSLGSNFYRIGYSTHALVIFGIVIDTWWKYLLIMFYQINRSILGSLLANFFWPWINVKLRMPTGEENNNDANEEGINSTESLAMQNKESSESALSSFECNSDVAIWTSFSQFCALIFFYFSSLTDVFFALSQVDFLAVRWLIDIAVNWTSTSYFIQESYQIKAQNAQNITQQSNTRRSGPAGMPVYASYRRNFSRSLLPFSNELIRLAI